MTTLHQQDGGFCSICKSECKGTPACEVPNAGVSHPGSSLADTVHGVAPAAPPGWKLVPLEPTPEMLDAMGEYEPMRDKLLRGIYKAAIEAAPGAVAAAAPPCPSSIAPCTYPNCGHYPNGVSPAAPTSDCPACDFNDDEPICSRETGCIAGMAMPSISKERSGRTDEPR